ncbi:hypothetical protein TNCV_1787111 [Trichonephila clavipes]|nr:hypothetical protein TNCV_1787111 [Trichonephila clavipes]
MPKREGPYLILTLRSPVTYEIADPANPDLALGTYHVSALKDYQEPETKRNTGFHRTQEQSRIPLVRKRKPTGRKKLTSEVLTDSERRANNARKVKTNNKEPSKKQRKKRRVSWSSSSQEIPLNTSCDSFDEDDNNDDFSAVYKGYFYAKKVYRWDVRDHVRHSCPYPGGVSFVFLSRASAAPLATTDSGPVRMDSSCVSSHPG